MNKKLIRLTESDLHNIIKESVKQVMNEIGDTEHGMYQIGRAAKRANDAGDGETWNMAKGYAKGREDLRHAYSDGYGDQKKYNLSVFMDDEEGKKNAANQIRMNNTMYRDRRPDVMKQNARDAKKKYRLPQ